MSNSDSLYLFISGATAAESLIAFYLFWRFSKKTKDSFFTLFALAFLLLAVERCVLLFFRAPSEESPYVYSLRLLSFAMILVAIVQKNRK